MNLGRGISTPSACFEKLVALLRAVSPVTVTVAIAVARPGFAPLFFVASCLDCRSMFRAGNGHHRELCALNRSTNGVA